MLLYAVASPSDALTTVPTPSPIDVRVAVGVALLAVTVFGALIYAAWRTWGSKSRPWIEALTIVLAACVAAGVAAVNGATTLATWIGVVGAVVTALRAIQALLFGRTWRPSVRVRARYLRTYVTQLDAHVNNVPAMWGRDTAFDFATIDQPAAIRDLRGPPDDLVGVDVAPDPYSVKGGAASRTDAAAALADPVHRLVVVLGEPGYGKSWLLRRTAARHTAILQGTLDHRIDAAIDAATLPVWLRLDDLAHFLTDRKSENLVDAIDAVLTTVHTDRTNHEYRAWLKERIADDSCVLLFDGLDEVQQAHMDRLRRALRLWITAHRAKHGRPPRVVITSRPIDNAWTVLDDADTRVLELLPFDRHAVERFVTARFPNPASQTEVLRLLHRRATAELARIPLLLTLLCRLADDTSSDHRPSRLPTRRSELFEAVLTQFIAQRPVGFDDTEHGLDDGAQWMLLEHIALSMATAEGGWAERIAHQELTAAVRRCPGAEERPPASSVIARLNAGGRGVLITAESSRPPTNQTSYRFLHRTFHEYLVARSLRDHPRRNHYIANHRWFDADWRQVLIMLTGQESAANASHGLDRDAYLHDLATSECDALYHGLFLAAAAAAEHPRPETSSAVDTIMARVAERIDSATGAFAADAIEALQPLCTIGYTAAVSLAIRHIRRNSSSVRHAAAKALEGTTDPDAVAALVDMLADGAPRVRTSAAQALAGTTDPAALPPLIELLDDDTAGVRAAAADALASTTDRDVVAALVDMLADDAPRVRGLAVRALAGTTDPTSRHSLRHSEIDRTSAASTRSRSTKRSRSLNTFATMTARSSTANHPTGRSDPISLGITCQVEAAGKNFDAVMSSMNAIGRRIVTGKFRSLMYPAICSLTSHDPIPVPGRPMPAAA